MSAKKGALRSTKKACRCGIEDDEVLFVLNMRFCLRVVEVVVEMDSWMVGGSLASNTDGDSWFRSFFDFDSSSIFLRLVDIRRFFLLGYSLPITLLLLRKLFCGFLLVCTGG